jgi:hypothetical protein
MIDNAIDSDLKKYATRKKNASKMNLETDGGSW